MGSITPSKRNYTDGKQLLPIILENRAQHDPQGVWAKFPISPTSYAQGFRSVTHLEMANAVNKIAWILQNTLGRSSSFETIAYLGPNDLRCTIVVLAGVKVGYKTFLPSPRNSQIAQISLLKRLDCKVLLTPSPELPCVSMILDELPLQKLVIPSVDELLAEGEVPAYPYNPDYEEAKNDPFFVLHTSGSTGIPKPLVYTHMFNTCVANITSLPARKGYVNLNANFQSGSFFSVFPSFHVVGIGFSMIIPSFHDCIPIYPLPSAPPTTAGFLEALKYTEIDWAFLPPVLIDELGKDLTSLEFVASKTKYLYFTGGAVPSATGDIVSSKLPIYQVMGSSECAMFPLIRPEGDFSTNEWSFISIHEVANGEFRHRFNDLYELVIVRAPENERFQAIFTHFPELQEYETRDLFAKHPTKEGMWKHRARIDDVIVFLNGEKTNPVTFEHEVSRHPEVRAALVVGHQRFEASLLVETVTSDALSHEQQLELIERIWPVVHEANTHCPAHARVSKSKILLADPDVPFLRAPKGTIVRQATLNLYEKKLDALYVATESETLEAQVEDIDMSDKASVAGIVRRIITRVTEWKKFEDGDDFFALGMDSLQVLQIRRGLVASLGIQSITTGDIYANPSVELLSAKLSTSGLANGTSVVQLEILRIENIRSTLKKYEAEIDKLVSSRMNGVESNGKQSSASEVVILTGSTGAVGSFILQKLLKNESTTIYCLNRSSNSEAIQRERNIERGLSTSFPSSRVHFLKADLTLPSFGLDASTYHTLTQVTTRIIHNAWPVNFNKTLQSFKPSLDGVLSLISFAASVPLHPSLFFISSISSVGNFTGMTPLIPETIITDLSTPAPIGYGESKYLSERMLDYASRKLHISTGVARVGQIAGTAENPRGWNRNEWFPSLVLSSRFLGALPQTLGLGDDEIDWVPIDQLVEILVELALGLNEDGEEGTKVFHPVHPLPTSWQKLLPTVKENLELVAESGKEVEIVSFREWCKLLRESSDQLASDVGLDVGEEDLRRNPGVKLLDFYESLLTEDGSGKAIKLDIKETLKLSESLRGSGPLMNSSLNGWVKDWFRDL